MSNLLLFRFLSGDASDVEWVVGKGDDLRLQHGDLTDLAAAASGHRCVLLMDASDVLLTTAAVPSKQRNTLLRAIPYALEDHLIDDVESLHFAIGERLPDGITIPVAVVRHTLIKDVMERCGAEAIAISAAVPEVQLVPYVEGEWTVIVDQDRALVRTGLHAGFSTDRDSLNLYLQFALRDLGENPLSRIRVIGQYSLVDVELPEGVEWVQEAGDLPTLVMLARDGGNQKWINLLQGVYSQRARIGRLIRPWRAAAALVLLVLAVQFAMNLAERYRLQSEHRALLSKIETVYRETFPDARRVVNAKVQMERRLKSLQQGSGAGEDEFLDLLGRTGPVLKASSGLELTAVDYRNGALTLGLSASSLETLDRLRAQLLSQGGLQVEIQSASSVEGRVTSRLEVKKAQG